MKDLIFGPNTYPKLQVGSEITTAIDIPLNPIAIRGILNYKHVDIKTQQSACEVLPTIKDAISTMTKLITQNNASISQLQIFEEIIDAKIDEIHKLEEELMHADNHPHEPQELQVAGHVLIDINPE